MKRKVRIIAVGVAIAAVALASASVVSAQTGATTFFACLKNGALTNVGTSASDCRSSGTLISWSQTGPVGPKGATGPVGPAGTAGTVGPAGTAGTEGPIGLTGPAGAPGAAGTAGTAGTAGAVGPIGLTGPAGAPGAQGLQGLPGVGAEAFGDETNLAVSGRGRECTIGEIILSAGGVANGAVANGQLLPIAQNTALFSLLGTTYGGNGTATFALPDLRSAAPDRLTYSICMYGIFPGPG